MKEYLKLVGIKWYTIWLTWFLRVFLMYFFLSLILAILGTISISTKEFDDNNKTLKKGLFYTTDFWVIFATFIVYSIQSAAFIVLFSQLFTKRKSLALNFQSEVLIKYFFLLKLLLQK